MTAGIRKKVIIIVAIILAIIIIAGTLTAFFVIRAKKNSNQNEEQLSNTSVLTNMINEAIVNKQLVTTNYTGTYKYKQIYSITFNKFSVDNPTGLTDADIQNLLKNNGVSDINSLLNKLAGEKSSLVEESNERITLISNENGEGICTISTNSEIKTYDFYGDDDLAIVINQIDESDYLYLSLNYSKLENAYLYSDTAVDSESDANLVFVFKDVYNEAGTIKLFTLTYAYERIPYEVSPLPEEDLNYNPGKL